VFFLPQLLRPEIYKSLLHFKTPIFRYNDRVKKVPKISGLTIFRKIDAKHRGKEHDPKVLADNYLH